MPTKQYNSAANKTLSINKVGSHSEDLYKSPQEKISGPFYDNASFYPKSIQEYLANADNNYIEVSNVDFYV